MSFPLKSFLAKLITFRNFHIPEMFPNLPYPGSADGSLWTIPVEARCYALLAVLGLCGMLKRRPIAILTIAILLIDSLATHGLFSLNRLNALGEVTLGADVSDLSSLVVCFVVGAAFYAWRESIPRSRVLAVIALALLVFSFRSRHQTHLLIPTTTGYLVFYIAFSPLRPLRWLVSHGDISYGIYLYAFPVQQTIIKFLGPHLSPTGLFLLAIPPTVALAIASWILIERPMLPRERRRRMVLESVNSATAEAAKDDSAHLRALSGSNEVSVTPAES